MSESSAKPLKSASFMEAAKMAFLSMKEAILPGYILLTLAAGVVIAYYNVPSFAVFMERAGDLKREWGYLFSMVTTALFAGLMPWIFRMLTPSARPTMIWRYLLFCLLLWSFQGFMIDTLYRVQGMIFGSEATPSVVACKVAADQFGYALLFSSPLISNLYYWADSGFSFASWKKTLGPGWYKKIVLPNYMANLTIWLPGVSIVYSLPSDLQIFMAGLINCFYALISTYIATKSKHRLEE